MPVGVQRMMSHVISGGQEEKGISVREDHVITLAVGIILKPVSPYLSSAICHSLICLPLPVTLVYLLIKNSVYNPTQIDAYMDGCRYV